MEWGDIGASVWLIGVLILVLLWIVGDRLRAFIFQAWGDKETIFSLLRKFSPAEVILKRLFLGISFVLIVIGLMQPRRLIGTHEVKAKVLNLVFALDCSYSMLAQDLKPNRLTRAKIEISSLLERLQGDRVALVVFAGQAMVQCPLTEDYYAFKTFLEAVDVSTIPTPGTNISSALASAYSLLKESEGAGAVVLITDGEDFYPDKTIEWAKRYKKEGIKIYCIGVGSEKGEPIPLPDGGFKRDRAGNVVLTRLDESLLIKIAQITGGAYLRAGAGSLQVEKMYELISKEHRTVNEAGVIPEYAQYYVYPLSLAMILLFWAWFLPLPAQTGARRWIKLVATALMAVLVSGWSIRDWKVNQLLKRYQRGRHEAVEELKELRKRHPDDPILNYNLGTIEAKEGKEADKYLGVAAQVDSPIKKQALYNLGNYYLRQNKLKEAISAYRQALIVDPNYTDARYNLELALKKLQEQNQKQRNSEQQQQDKKQNKEDKQDKGSRGDNQQKEKGSDSQDSQSKREKSKEKEESSGQGEEQKEKQQSKESDQSQSNQGQGEDERESKGNNGDEKERGKSNMPGSEKREGKGEDKEDVEAILSALREDELRPSQVNKRAQLRGEYDVDKDW